MIPKIMKRLLIVMAALIILAIAGIFLAICGPRPKPVSGIPESSTTAKPGKTNCS